VQLGLLVLLVMAPAPPGRAPLRLQLDRCADIDRAAIDRVVTTELEAALADESAPGAVTTAHAECAESRVRLTIDDPVTGKSTTRSLDLDGQPRSLRSRLLGLAIAEAVLASWIELQLPREALAPLAGASPETRREAAGIAERHLQATARPAPALEISAGPALRWFSSGLLTLGLAGSARHWLDRQPRAGLGLTMDGSYGGQSVPGVARASALSFALAPSLLTRSDFGSFGVTASAGVRVGLARLAAVPANPMRSGRSAWRGFGGPFLAVDFSVPLGRSLFLHASGESGYVVVPAQGGVDSVEVVALSGAWLGAVLSLGMKL
jgi:hypothetical protein